MDAARSICARATDNLAIFEARLMFQSRALKGPFVSRIISVEKCEKIISCACMYVCTRRDVCVCVCFCVCALLTLLRPVVALGVLDVKYEIGLTGWNHADGCCMIRTLLPTMVDWLLVPLSRIGRINFDFNFRIRSLMIYEFVEIDSMFRGPRSCEL